MFFNRSYKKEMMDDFSINNGRIDIALKELKIINKYLGGNSTTKAGLKKILSGIHSESQVKILDAGGGASDILLSLKDNPLRNMEIFSADINKRIAKYVKQNSPQVEVICADVFNLPFKPEQFDIVHLSLFLHHFKEEEIKEILFNLSGLAKFGIIINDLQRSFIALMGIKILTMLFSKSDMVKNDAPLSVKKSFIKKDLVKILNVLNFKFEIKYKWAFRWLVVVYKKA